MQPTHRDHAVPTGTQGPTPDRATDSTRVLLVVCVATFMASLDLFIVNIAFPDIQLSFGRASDASVSWVLNAYAIVFAALLVPAGRLADLAGRRRTFTAGVLVFVLASALCAAAPSVGWLVAARVGQAVGAAALMPASLALLLANSTPARRPGAVAIWSASGAVAAAAGPPLGGLLLQLSWHWVFLVNVPVGLVTVVLATRVLHESRDPAAARLPDLLGAVVLALGIGLLTLAVVKGSAWGWGSPATVGSFVAAAGLLVMFVARCVRHPLPVIEVDLLRVRAFAAANVAALVFFTGFASMLLGSVLFLTRVWHEGALTAGLQIAPGPLMAAVFSVPAGLLTVRYGPRNVAVPGALLFGIGALWWLTQLASTPHYAGGFLPGMLIGGAGVGLTLPTLANAVAAGLPPHRFATGSAVFAMSRQLGAALGVAVFIAALGTPGRGQALAAFQRGWALMLGASLFAALAAATIGPRPGPRTPVMAPRLTPEPVA